MFSNRKFEELKILLRWECILKNLFEFGTRLLMLIKCSENFEGIFLPYLLRRNNNCYLRVCWSQDECHLHQVYIWTAICHLLSDYSKNLRFCIVSSKQSIKKRKKKKIEIISFVLQGKLLLFVKNKFSPLNKGKQLFELLKFSSKLIKVKNK